ncbi:MAG: septum formation protein Maf [Hungatella sp.]|nr:septum formation protein Maf [Hungatella sp.]
MKEGRWILASGSPRRRELLEQIGVEFEVRISGVEERTSAVMPEDVVLELSGLKAEDVAREAPEGSWILGADTVVAVDGRIMGKPGSHKEACEMIRSLQGRTHQVFTGVTLICKEGRGQKGVSFVEKTDVTLYPMSEEEIREYGESEEPMDKAGAYGIQGRFARYVSRIDGDYSNVVGLPVGRVYQEWKSLVEREEEDD